MGIRQTGVQVDCWKASYSAIHAISRLFSLSISEYEAKAMLVVCDGGSLLSVPLILLCCASPTPTHTHTHKIYAHKHSSNTSKRSAAKIEVSRGNYTPNKSVTHSFSYVRSLCSPPPVTTPLTFQHVDAHTCTPASGLYNQIYWEVTLAQNAQKLTHTHIRLLPTAGFWSD